jgi:hypothetical protein
MRLLKALWVRWKIIAHKIATFQSRVLLFVFYYLVMAPFAIGMRLVSDPLQLRPNARPVWFPRQTHHGDIRMTARRQF